MSKVYLGLDTSNYRTSIAAVSGQGEVLFERAELLDVKKGARGLRQSEAFFVHSNRLPGFISGLFEAVDPSDIAAIGVSEKPRRVEGSYMPCFLAGLNAASEIGSALRVPVYRFSHQEGHASAVLGDERDDVLFMHLSGGTTEFLKCSADECGYDMQIIGGTKDISIGQLLDRTGVALGYPFPSGAYLDELAYGLLSDCDFNISDAGLPGIMPRIKTYGGMFNLSGAETKILRYISDNVGCDKSTLAAELLVSIYNLLKGCADELAGSHGINTVYMAGGVASSRTLRELLKRSDQRSDIRLGRPERSGDNAVGTALLARRIDETRKRIPGK
jgi:N6-L-threonylcarbamoyladenine synthase